MKERSGRRRRKGVKGGGKEGYNNFDLSKDSAGDEGERAEVVQAEDAVQDDAVRGHQHLNRLLLEWRVSEMNRMK